MRFAPAVLLMFAASGFAQQTASPPPLTERVDVTLVNVDVTVLDPRGNPVTDLTRDDFEVREDGVPREITNFAVFRSESVMPKPKATGAAFTSDPEQRRSVVVLVDARAMGDKPERSRAVDALQNLLARYPDDSKWSVVVLRDGMRSMQTLLPSTDDRAAIKEALAAVRNGVSLPGSVEATVRKLRAVGAGNAAGNVRAAVDAAYDMDMAVSFYSAVIQVARSVAWLPGRKVVLLVSSAVPGYARPGTLNAEALAQMHERMVEEANAAGANIYIIDPLGVSAKLDMGGGNERYAAIEGNAPRDAGQRNTSAATWLSDGTGGLYLPSNDMGESLDKLQRATTNYYELAYHAPAADNKYHRIAVALKKPGRYTVTHRQGYMRLSRDEAFARTLTTPVGIAAQKAKLPVRLTTEQPQAAADGTFKVPFRATLPVASLQTTPNGDSRSARAHVYVSAFDKDGRLVQFFHFVETVNVTPDTAGRDLAVARGVVLQKGTYKLFVTIRDELTDDVGVAAKDVTL